MKKIAHIFNSIEYSGAERMIYSLKGFYTSEYDPYIVSTGSTKGEMYEVFENEFKCKHIPFSKLGVIGFCFNFYKFFKMENIQVVHIHPARNFFINVMVAKIAGVKIIIRQVHNNFEFKGLVRLREIFTRRIVKLMNAEIVSISPSVYLNEINRFKNKTVQINNFYDDNKFFSISEFDKNKLREKYNVPFDAFVLITVGECCERKQHSHVIEAIGNLKLKIPNIFYLHLGEGEDLETEKKQCIDKGLENEIVFVGNVSNVRDYLAMSDLYLMPSKIEGLSIAAIEAMATGITCMLYDTPGSRDLGLNDAPGILIAPNVISLEKEILKLHGSGLENIRELGSKSYIYSLKNYSMHIAIEKWRAIYNGELKTNN